MSAKRLCELTVGGEVLFFADARDMVECAAALAKSVRPTHRADPTASRQAVLLVPTEVTMRMPRNPEVAATVRAAVGARVAALLEAGR